jgi:Mrp family chromosome partitioning ATPase
MTVLKRNGAPLPMVTQPITPIDDGTPQRVDPHSAQPFGGAARSGGAGPIDPAVVFGKATVVSTPAPTPRPVASGPAPEIGLVQHTLSADERLDDRLVLVEDPDSERSAAFRVLRHHLLEAGRPQVIVVSSAVNDEGKTTTAVNLALALAECGRAKVLLAETHVRRPQLAGVFKLVPPWCFAEQLAAHRHQPMLPWNLVEIPQLWIHVGAVNPRIEKSQLLDAPAFAIAMERLRNAGYDHIVIDAPPILGSADVNLMADAADAVVLTARARTSTTRDLHRAIDQLGTAKIAGTVLVE